MQAFHPLLALVLALACPACSSSDTAGGARAEAVDRATATPPPPDQDSAVSDDSQGSPSADPQLATFGAGCFWCVEAVLEQLDGVLDVTSGYMGGHVEDPSYKQVCTGATGHAEVVQVTYDPSVLPYAELLRWFWKLHDPTTLNRQGADVGTQYRSAIFYHSEEQRETAERSKQAVEEAGVFDDPIVTEITAASTYYEADEYHQDYYRSNKEQGYCRMVISPKLDKLGLDN